MRIRSLFFGDIRTQFKYGFYFLYIVFSLIYIALLFVFPQSWREKAALIMILTDPSALGLYFLGAIVLYEKSEKVLDSIAISPVKPYEYVLSKVGSLAVISTLSAFAIRLSADIQADPILFAIGVFLASCLFSSVGLMIACKIKTLNQFIIATIPAEIIIFLPPILWFFGARTDYLSLHPAVCMVRLCTGDGSALGSIIILSVWVIAFIFLASKVFKKELQSVGGMKL